MPIGRLVMWIILYVVVMATLRAAFQFIQGIYAPIMDYKIYVDILLTLFFGWQIVKAAEGNKVLIPSTKLVGDILKIKK